MSVAAAPVPVVLFTNSPFMGGMEEHIQHLGRGLVRRGFPVALVCSTRSDIEPLRQTATRDGVVVHTLAERQRSRLGTAKRLARLVQTLRAYPGAVLHMHLTGHMGGELVQLAGRMAGVRAIVRTEHLPPAPPIHRRERVGVALRDRLLDRVICVSNQTSQDHVRWLSRPADKFRVVPNCVELGRFDPAHVSGDELRAQLGCDPRTPLVGTVSRLGEWRKGITHFLEMAALVSTTRSDARFVVVGGGPLRADLERLANTLGVADRVVFTGERHDIPRVLAAMDVFVMPSLYEGGPITVLEAMAMRKPVVSTPVGMVPDVIQNGVNGLLAPISDAPALATAVGRLLDDPQFAHCMAERGRETVVRGFSPDAMVDGVAAVYRELTAK
jgi:glycosyltransferase involved in cell wall biosynthesis